MSKLAVSPRRRSGTSFSVIGSPSLISFFSKNMSRICSFVNSSARRMMLTGSLRRRSMRTNTESFGSNSKSSQEPRYGITRAENSSLPLECVLPLSWSKNTPGLRCSCETMTRSVPLMTNVPWSVISGISPR